MLVKYCRFLILGFFCFAIAGCATLSAQKTGKTQSAIRLDINVFALPVSKEERAALERVAYQTIGKDDWSGFCRAPRREIEARITLIGDELEWSQIELDKIRAEELRRIRTAQQKYAPKPDIVIANLKSNAVRGKAIRDLEDYDQYWASALFRYPEIRTSVSEKNLRIFSLLYNREQCEEGEFILRIIKEILKSPLQIPIDANYGESTVASLYLITQHADSDVEFQKKMLAFFIENPGTLKPSSLAYLTDRVKVNSGELQVYGSQLLCTDDGYVPKPVVEPDQLDQRRALVGLEPFAGYAASTPGCGNDIQF